jgi:hypothetical protein
MNSEIPHQVVFLHETLVFVNGTDPNIWVIELINLLRRGGNHQVPGTLLFMLEHKM